MLEQQFTEIIARLPGGIDEFLSIWDRLATLEKLALPLVAAANPQAAAAISAGTAVVTDVAEGADSTARKLAADLAPATAPQAPAQAAPAAPAAKPASTAAGLLAALAKAVAS